MPSPKRPPAFQFYADAWLGSVSVETMPANVEGTYIRLLARQWKAHIAGDEVLPKDPAVLRLLTKLTPAEWKKAWPQLEKHFPVQGSGRANPTLAAVWQDRADFVQAQRENGKKGGRPQREPGQPAPHNPNLPAKESQRKPKPSQSANPTGNPNESSVVCSLETDTTPTAAAAAVSPLAGAAAAADVHDPIAYAERREAIRQRFADERHVLAFDRHVRASQFPDVFLLDLEAASRERPSDGKPAVPWDVIGTVLHELSVKGKRPTEHLIRVFAEPMLNPRADRAPDATAERPKTDAEIEAEFMARIERGDFLPPELREVPA